MPRLTRRVIEQTPCPPTGESWLPDDLLPGFGIRLRAGRKSYCVRYRTAAGAPRRENLGLTTVLTLEQARSQAQAILATVRQGHDPAQVRQSLRAGPTVADLAARYLAEHVAVHNKPNTARIARMVLRLHILPALGTRKVSQLTRHDMATLHQGLRETPVQANLCLVVLSKMCTLAEQWGWREPRSNPVYQVTPYRTPSRERFLTPEELLRLGAVLTQAEAMRLETPQVLACVRLLLLTGARVSELLSLRWKYLHQERGLALLPDSKTGSKPLYLSSQALEVLQAVPRESAWVFPGERSTGHLPGSTMRKAWNRIRREAGLADVRLHDLRHSFASYLAMAGVSLPIIGRLLGHTEQRTTQRYAHFADDPVRQAAERAGALMGQAMGEG